MKLSELNTDRALDVLCELTPYVENIVSDEAVVSAVGKVIKYDSQMNRYGLFLVGIEKISKIIPLLLKTHRADMYGILSAINSQSVEEIAAQNSILTLRQIREVLQDKELIDFFKSSAPQEQKEQSAPSVPSHGSE